MGTNEGLHIALTAAVAYGAAATACWRALTSLHLVLGTPPTHVSWEYELSLAPTSHAARMPVADCMLLVECWIIIV